MSLVRSFRHFLSRTDFMRRTDFLILSRFALRRTAVGTAMVAAAMMATACGGLLDVSDPTLVRDSDIANAGGANGRRLQALAVFSANLSEEAEYPARMSDELMVDQPATGDVYDYLDKRDSEGYELANGTSDHVLGILDRAFYETTFALPSVRAYSPDSLRGDFLGQLYAMRGYAILQAAEDLCPGFPLNDVSADSRPVFSGPLTTDSALSLASATLDSALKYLQDSARFVTLARVAKGRTLLDQGKYAEAAAVVGPVATGDVYQTNTNNSIYNDILSVGFNQGSYNMVMGERQGGNGMPFASANDPRVTVKIGGTAVDDSTDTLYIATKYTSTTDPLTLASGIEARLIEAEAALHANDPNWLTILNTLRATAISPVLPALIDPGTTAARVDLLYSERAFWLYLTGRRLGDMRRLIKNYGRNAETVFPTGNYPSGGQYGTATAIPFSVAAQQQSNPYITTGCTTR